MVICKIQLIIPVFILVALLHGLIYSLIINNRDIKVIDKVKCILWKVGKANVKYKMAFINPDNILWELYIIAICKIYTFFV